MWRLEQCQVCAYVCASADVCACVVSGVVSGTPKETYSMAKETYYTVCVVSGVVPGTVVSTWGVYVASGVVPSVDV